MRLLVCGSRTLNDYSLIWAGCSMVSGWTGEDPDVLIHGAAPGVDSIAAKWAEQMGVAIEAFPADWSTLGKAAGPIRNQRMLDEGKPDVVLAFVDKPLNDSRGTSDMVRRATVAGVPVLILETTHGREVLITLDTIPSHTIG